MKVILSILICICCFEAYGQFNSIHQRTNYKKIDTEFEYSEIKKNDDSEVHKMVDFFSRNILVDSIFSKRKLLCLPLDTLIYTSMYGNRVHPIYNEMKFHYGVDLQTMFSPIYSIMYGRVIKTGYNKTLGNFVEIKHGDFTSLYAHLYEYIVEKNQLIQAGDLIGISGSTGKSTGDHLHFGMKYDGENIDPKPILDYIVNIIQISNYYMTNLKTNPN